MAVWAARSAQVIVGLGMLGALFLQVLIVVQSATEFGPPAGGYAVVTCAVLFFVCVEIALICLLRLLSMASRGSIFHVRAFAWVNALMWSAVAAGAFVFAAAVIMASLPDATGPAPGMILLMGVFGALCEGVALVVVVLRGLLVQAIASRREAADLRAELDEVI